MKSTYKRAAVSLAAITTSLAFVAGVALAGPTDHVDGEPQLWGPGLAALCDDPTLPAAQGYNLIEDEIASQQAGGILLGTPGPDLILAYNGNDDVFAGRGNDVIGGGSGEDTLHGEVGNEAIFGEGHIDTLKGDNGDDFLDSGPIGGRCDGGNGFDATASCGTVNP